MESEKHLSRMLLIFLLFPPLIGTQTPLNPLSPMPKHLIPPQPVPPTSHDSEPASLHACGRPEPTSLHTRGRPNPVGPAHKVGVHFTFDS